MKINIYFINHQFYQYNIILWILKDKFIYIVYNYNIQLCILNIYRYLN